ncbi:hypothetical protein PR048_003999 [Dryococelus australis]|uniref:Uncharacterized protein n=1 Tax=Dryococelus australis TaxID=614101 RepID=A0ABQ9I533_9NEOP|nr:hypothetical protein PR048_003999 [Dryococelus australis]
MSLPGTEISGDNIPGLELTTVMCHGGEYIPGYMRLKVTSVLLFHSNTAAPRAEVAFDHGFLKCTSQQKLRGRGGVMVRLLASYQSEPGSIPDGVARGFSHVVIVPDHTAVQRVFSGISHFPRPSFRHCSIITSLHRLSRPRYTWHGATTSTTLHHHTLEHSTLPCNTRFTHTRLCAEGTRRDTGAGQRDGSSSRPVTALMALASSCGAMRW